MKKIAIDIDGTLTYGDHSLINYLAMRPNWKVIGKINELHRLGHEIIIYTSRPRQEHHHLIEWLEEHGIEFDHLECGKLKADYYVDANALDVNEFWKKETW